MNEEESFAIPMMDIPLIGDVMALWRQGKNTWDMSQLLKKPEWEVARALRLGREHKRITGG